MGCSENYCFLSSQIKFFLEPLISIEVSRLDFDKSVYCNLCFSKSVMPTEENAQFSFHISHFHKEKHVYDLKICFKLEINI